MSDFPVDIFRVAYDGTREEDKIPMSVFQTGRHFREGWATCDDQCETLQEMFYNQVCERVLLDRFAKYPATKLELYCVPITICKQIGVNDYRFTKVTYGEWKENWEKNGWQNTEVRMPTFRWNNASAKKTALEKMRQLYWWRPPRSLAYAEALTVYALIPEECKYDLSRYEMVPNPKYSYYKDQAWEWIKRVNPDYWEAVEQYQTRKDPRSKKKYEEMMDWLASKADEFYYTKHHIERPKPVITREELEEQQRSHKKKPRFSDDI